MTRLLCSLCLSFTLLLSAQAADEEFSQFMNKIESFTLDNGLTIILYPRGDAPVISCVTYVKTGSTDEHVGITGIAHQLEHLAFKGTTFVGTNDYAGEKAAMTELDKLYGTIQSLEQKVPAEMRDAFLSLLAQVTSTGSGRMSAEQAKAMMEKQAQTLLDAWKKAGVTLSEADQKTLINLVTTYSEKVSDAEKFVIQNQYSNLIDRAGGSGLNAFTSVDQTVYHVSLPANRLELWAALESDRFMNTVPRQIEKEKQVVLEERRMRTESNAFGKLYESLLGVAFQAHPYGVAVIGHRSDILGYNREKIMKFYRERYVPSETIVSVVGDIDVPATKKLLTQYFSKIPAAPAPRPAVTVEPPQEGERRLDVEYDSQPMLILGYHIPERNHPDTPALIMLSQIATSGRTSRLEANLVKTKKANTVASWIGPGDRYPRLMFFRAEMAANPNPKTTPADIYTQKMEGITALEADMLREIEKLKTEVPTPEEMKRVITRYRAGVLRGMRSNLSLAQDLADYQAVSGEWRDLFRDIQAISKVTPEQVTAMAQKYLTKVNRTVGRVVPPEPAKAPAPQGKAAAVEFKGDGLEGDGNWMAERWDNANPSKAEIVTRDNNKMIAVTSEGGEKDKIAFSRYGQALNLTDSEAMVFKAYNDSDRPLSLAVAFVNASGDFHESRQQTLPARTWAKLSYSVNAKEFRSNRNEFKDFDQELHGREHTARLVFLAYEKRPVNLLIDSVFFR